MLPRRQRLTKTRDFKEILGRGKSFRGDKIVAKTEQAKNQESRFAVVVSKKVSAKATRRNRIRRLISEAIKQEMRQIPANLDIVFIVLPGFKAQNLQAARSIIGQVIRKMLAPKTR